MLSVLNKENETRMRFIYFVFFKPVTGLILSGWFNRFVTGLAVEHFYFALSPTEILGMGLT